MTEQAQRRRVVGGFGASIVDQIALSGANFLVGFLLIRMTTDHDYAMYILVQAAVLLLLSAQGALIGAPLAVIVPRRNPEDRRALIGAVFTTQRRLLLRVALGTMPLPLAGFLLGWWSGPVAAVCSAGIMMGWFALRREFLRGVLMMYSRPFEVLRADVVYIGLMLTGVVAAVTWLPYPAVTVVLSLAIGAWFSERIAHRNYAGDPGWVSGDFLPHWQDMKKVGLWAFAGIVAYWLYTQSYNYMLAGRLGLTAVADANAARLLVMPINTVATGLRALLVPSTVRWYVHLGFDRMLRRLTLFAIGASALAGLMLGAIWLLRDFITDDLLHKTIGDRDRLLLIYGLVILVGVVRDVYQCGLIALGDLKNNFWVTCVSTVAALSIFWVGIPYWGVAAAFIGQLTGELLSLVGVVVLLVRGGKLATTTA